MIYIVPSRGRPHVMSELIESWAVSRTTAKLHIAVDDSDPLRDAYRKVLYHAPEWVSWLLVASEGMVSALNYCAMRYVDTEDVIGFMGDDHRPRGHAWDARILQAMREQNSLIAYANDLLQGANLPTQVAIDTRVIKTLGFMAPPVLGHLYVDNYWKTLGERLQRLTYLPQVVIEHMHPVAGKAKWDEGHLRVNDGSVYERDRIAFDRYVSDGRMFDDVMKCGDI